MTITNSVNYSSPSVTHVLTVDGLVIPLSKISAISDKQFKDEEGVVSELKYGAFDSSVIFIKVDDVVHPVKTSEEWVKPFIEYGRSTYDHSYVKYVIYYNWSILQENKR
jgi:hypothetical protein